MLYYIILILIFFLYMYLYTVEKKITVSPSNIFKKGFIYYEFNIDLDNLNVNDKKNIIKNSVLEKLPKDYIFLDYYYYIKGCSLSTFHRDVTSGQKYLNTKHPTYTIILYEYEGDFLSLCPNSYKQFPFITSKVISISGNKNTIVIFNSDILHAGIINSIGQNRKVLQFKVVHKEDLYLCNDLNKILVEKNTNCNLNNNLEHILRFSSLHFAWLINGFMYPLSQKKYNNGYIKYIQEQIPISFYNNIKE
jgi:hypothetical protein